MKGERTKEDREHIDDEKVKDKELKELMPDEAHAIERAEKKPDKPGNVKPNIDKPERR
jgi:hypothetical protein